MAATGKTAMTHGPHPTGLQCPEAHEMKTHTLGMWSRCLGGADNSKSGHPYNCHKAIDVPGHTRVLQDIVVIIPSIAKKYTRIGGFERLNHNLITESVKRLNAGAEQEDSAEPKCVETREVLLHLSQETDLRIDVSPPPISPQQGGDDWPLTPRTAVRGLGAMGSVPIPLDMWRRHTPTNWVWVAARTLPVGASKGQGHRGMGETDGTQLAPWSTARGGGGAKHGGLRQTEVNAEGGLHHRRMYHHLVLSATHRTTTADVHGSNGGDHGQHEAHRW